MPSSSSCSSPSDYRQFREAAKKNRLVDSETSAAAAMAVLNGKPYFPLMQVNVNNGDNDESERLDSVKRVTACIMNHETNRPNDSVEAEEVNKNDWKHLKVRTVSGGITNTLYLVSGLKSPVDQVLVRVFGAEGMIDRDLENCTFAALADFDDNDNGKEKNGNVNHKHHTNHHHHHHSIAPPYFGRFANGRIEGWMDGYRHLQVREMAQPAIAAGIARKLGEMHSAFTVPDSLKEYYPSPDDNPDHQPGLWTQLDDWLKQSLSAKFQTDHDTERAAEQLELAVVQTELDWLKTQIPVTAKTVFCHNDLLAANVMCKPGGSSTAAENDDDNTAMPIQLIDFEYGGINYRSFDIANHFAEYAGGPPADATPVYEWLPNAAAQQAFCRHYLQAYHENETTTNGNDEVDVSDQAVHDLYHEVQAFGMATHLYWGLWAVNQAATEGCADYDYLLYGINRFRQYWVSKQEYCCDNGVAADN